MGPSFWPPTILICILLWIREDDPKYSCPLVRMVTISLMDSLQGATNETHWECLAYIESSKVVKAPYGQGILSF